MARSTFKTTYLVSKSDLENRNDNNAKIEFQTFFTKSKYLGWRDECECEAYQNKSEK